MLHFGCNAPNKQKMEALITRTITKHAQLRMTECFIPIKDMISNKYEIADNLILLLWSQRLDD